MSLARSKTINTYSRVQTMLHEKRIDEEVENMNMTKKHLMVAEFFEIKPL